MTDKSPEFSKESRHTAPVWAVAISPDGTRLAVAALAGEVGRNDYVAVDTLARIHAIRYR